MAAGEPDPSPPDGGPWEKEKVRKGRRGQGDNAGRPCNLRPGTARGPGREVQRKRDPEGEKRLKQNRKIKAGDKREAEREKEKRRGKRGKGERGTKSEKTR